MGLIVGGTLFTIGAFAASPLLLWAGGSLLAINSLKTIRQAAGPQKASSSED